MLDAADEVNDAISVDDNFQQNYFNQDQSQRSGFLMVQYKCMGR